jgi:hypothetical protein
MIVSIYFLLLSSNHPDKLILKTSTMFITFDNTVSFANVGQTQATIFAKLKFHMLKIYKINFSIASNPGILVFVLLFKGGGPLAGEDF